MTWMCVRTVWAFSSALEQERLLILLQEYELAVALNGKIDPSKSRYTILKSKLEVCLQKLQMEQWPQLMADENQQKTAHLPQQPVQQPSYPSSFKRCV